MDLDRRANDLASNRIKRCVDEHAYRVSKGAAALGEEKTVCVRQALQKYESNERVKYAINRTSVIR